MFKLFSVFVFATSLSLVQQATAQTSYVQSPAQTKKIVPAKAAAAAEKKVLVEEDEEENKVPDISGSQATEYNCDHGNKVTFYEQPGDDAFVALRWNKQLLRMRRISTTTGAIRFESKRHGLVWIGIPSKSLLLDSKKGQQLANECKNLQQVLNLS